MQVHYLGRTADEQGISGPHGQAANILWVKAINILLIADSIKNALLVDVLWKWQLH